VSWAREHLYLAALLSRAKHGWIAPRPPPAARGGEVQTSAWVPESVPAFGSLSDTQRQNVLRQFASPELLPILRGPEASRRVALTERVLDELRAEIRSRCAAMSILIIPYKQQIVPAQRREWMRLHDRATSETFRPQEEIGDWCRRRGIAYADATEAMLQEADPNALFWPIDGHLTSAGHRLVARVAARLLEESSSSSPTGGC